MRFGVLRHDAAGGIAHVRVMLKSGDKRPDSTARSRATQGVAMSENKAGCGCCGGGIFGSIGAVFAALLSWSVNHSILWALFHAFLSWIYVIYHWVEYGHLLP